MDQQPLGGMHNPTSVEISKLTINLKSYLDNESYHTVN